MQETSILFLGWEDPLENRLPTPVFFGFGGGSDGKESACKVGDTGFDPRIGKILWRRAWLQYSCLENPHGQRSLGGYSPWGHKKLDTTKHSTGLTFSSMICYELTSVYVTKGLNSAHGYPVVPASFIEKDYSFP